MILLFSLTAFVILLYLAYPLWLGLVDTGKAQHEEKETEEISRVSVILLSYEGKIYLKDKIRFLLSELKNFEDYELIIIDDHSIDGSEELLNEFRTTEHIRLLCNSQHTGIPHSLNEGVAMAKFDYLIFCDQRQELSEGILKRIVEPLKYKHVGAVSGCISVFDKAHKPSIFRGHENFLKARESRAGNLMGVYGPFYAIKKQCYVPIPEHIILDDLYLSLRILKSKQIEWREDCEIIDENFTTLYDYRRTRRYLAGLLQLLRERSIVHDLNTVQRTMLLWHKYLRLVIPFMLFLCYASLAFAAPTGKAYALAFALATSAGLLSLLPIAYLSRFKVKNMIRMNIYYLLALAEVLVKVVKTGRI